MEGGGCTEPLDNALCGSVVLVFSIYVQLEVVSAVLCHAVRRCGHVGVHIHRHEESAMLDACFVERSRVRELGGMVVLVLGVESDSGIGLAAEDAVEVAAAEALLLVGQGGGEELSVGQERGELGGDVSGEGELGWEVDVDAGGFGEGAFLGGGGG